MCLWFLHLCFRVFGQIRLSTWQIANTFNQSNQFSCWCRFVMFYVFVFLFTIQLAKVFIYKLCASHQILVSPAQCIKNVLVIRWMQLHVLTYFKTCIIGLDSGQCLDKTLSKIKNLFASCIFAINLQIIHIISHIVYSNFFSFSG